MSLTADIQAFSRLAQQNVDAVTRGVVLRIASEVIRKSPVDTGRFRANWQHGEGEAPDGMIESTENTALSRIAAAVPQRASGKVHYITNNLPYAQALEDGHSPQSGPGNMVAGTVQAFETLLADAARNL